MYPKRAKDVPNIDVQASTYVASRRFGAEYDSSQEHSLSPATQGYNNKVTISILRVLIKYAFMIRQLARLCVPTAINVRDSSSLSNWKSILER